MPQILALKASRESFTVRVKIITGSLVTLDQENLRRLWRSRRRKSSSVPEGGADFPAAIFLAGKCPTLAGIAFRSVGKSGNNFPAASKFAGKLFQQ